jgi:release factor glutamine methyltransferase
LYFEINEKLGAQVVNLLTEEGFNHIQLRKDLQGKDRMVKASR